MKKNKPDLRKNNGGHSIKTKFPDGFERVQLKLRPEEKACFKDLNMNDELRAMIRDRFQLDAFPPSLETDKYNPYYEDL